MTGIAKRIQVAILHLTLILVYQAGAYGQSTASPNILQGHRAGVTSVRFSPDGAWLASSSLDGTVRVWSTKTWKTVKILNHGAEVYAVEFSPDGNTLISGGFDKRLVFWQMKSGKMVHSIALPDWINAITFTRTGQLVIGSADGIVRVMNSNGATVKRTIDTRNEVGALAVSNDEHYLVTGGGRIKLWDFASGKFLKNINGFAFYSFAFSPTGSQIASAEATGGVKISSIPDGKLLEELQIVAKKEVSMPPGNPPISVSMPATSVAFSPGGNWLATGDSMMNILLWKVTDDKISEISAQTLSGHTMTVTCVKFSPDGKQIVSASLDRTIRVWSL